MFCFIKHKVCLLFSACYVASCIAVGAVHDATDYKSNMYGQLIFPAVGAEPEVIFESYELVRIAQELMEELITSLSEVLEENDSDTIVVPQYASNPGQIDDEFNKFTRQLIEKAAVAHQVDADMLQEIVRTRGLRAVFNADHRLVADKVKQEKGLHSFLVQEDLDAYILPVQLKVDASSIGLLRVVDYLKKSDEPIQGWWVIVNGRLILLKNISSKNGMHLYVSDHDVAEDVRTQTKENLLDFVNDRAKMSKALTMWNSFMQLSEQEQEEMKNAIGSLEKVRYAAKQTEVFGIITASCNVTPLFCQIEQFFRSDDASKWRVRWLLKEVAKRTDEGSYEHLFWTENSFGSREDGEPYRVFAAEFDKYYASATALSEVDVAKAMRDILKGKAISASAPNFLPALAASWFYAEAARNNVSILSGLMLLDFIEAGVAHIDGDGNNLYSWKYALVHPRKKTGKVLIKNLYGDKINLGAFDGMHPMAHGGSVSQSKTELKTDEKLTAVHQKEGHLLVDWLSKKLLGTIKTTTMLIPDYSKFNSLSNEGITDLAMIRKNKLIETIKQMLETRALSLDCMLPA